MGYIYVSNVVNQTGPTNLKMTNKTPRSGKIGGWFIASPISPNLIASNQIQTKCISDHDIYLHPVHMNREVINKWIINHKNHP